MKSNNCEKNKFQSPAVPPEFSIYDFKRFWTQNRKDLVCDYLQRRLIVGKRKDLESRYLDIVNDVMISFIAGPESAIFLLPNSATWDDLYESILKTVRLRLKYLRLGTRYRDSSVCLFYDGKVHFDSIGRDLNKLPSIRPYKWWADKKRLVAYDSNRDDNHIDQSKTQLDDLIGRETGRKIIARVLRSRDELDWQIFTLYLLPGPNYRPTQERIGEIAAQTLKRSKKYSAVHINSRLGDLRKWLKTIV